MLLVTMNKHQFMTFTCRGPETQISTDSCDWARAQSAWACRGPETQISTDSCDGARAQSAWVCRGPEFHYVCDGARR